MNIQIQRVDDEGMRLTHETLTLTLDDNAKCRHSELSRALKPLDWIFCDYIGLMDLTTGEYVAELVSDPVELDDWCDVTRDS